MTDPRDAHGPPSDHAARRKEAMRSHLLAALDRRRRRRIGLQAGAGVVGLAMLALVAKIQGPTTTNPSPPPEVATRQAWETPEQTHPLAAGSTIVTIVGNDPGVLSRCVISRPIPTDVRYASDAELLAGLAAAGESFGLARVAGRFDRLVNNNGP